MITTISATLSSLKTALDLTKTALAVRDDGKIAEATQLLNERIFDVQNAALSLQEKMSAQRDEIEALKEEKRTLSAKLSVLEAQKSERDRYALYELVPGSYVLAYTGPSDPKVPMHYICQTCMENTGVKSVLQQFFRSAVVRLICNHCKTEFATGRNVKFTPQRLPQR